MVARLCDSGRRRPVAGHKCLESWPEKHLPNLPRFQWSFLGGCLASAVLVLLALGEVFNGMEIISSSHMNVEKKIFNPDGRIRRSIVLFDVYGFKPFRKLVFHNLIGEA